jgi:hypothetical protein
MSMYEIVRQLAIEKSIIDLIHVAKNEYHLLTNNVPYWYTLFHLS